MTKMKSTSFPLLPWDLAWTKRFICWTWLSKCRNVFSYSTNPLHVVS